MYFRGTVVEQSSFSLFSFLFLFLWHLSNCYLVTWREYYSKRIMPLGSFGIDTFRIIYSARHSKIESEGKELVRRFVYNFIYEIDIVVFVINLILDLFQPKPLKVQVMLFTHEFS